MKRVQSDLNNYSSHLSAQALNDPTAAVAVSAATTATLSTAGVAVVAHSSGPVILTGTGGYIAGTLGAAGTTVVAALTAPLTIAVGVVTVVGVGGSVYLCK